MNKMKQGQQFTPKYWVFHNTDTDDVYLDTAAKSWDDCVISTEQLHLNELMDFYNNESTSYAISLVEIKIVMASK